MSDQEQAMKAAQLANALQENNQLKAVVRQVSAQCHAQRQCVEEYMNANINIRTAMLMLEEDNRNLSAQVNQHIARINALEAENKQLRADAAGTVLDGEKVA